MIAIIIIIIVIITIIIIIFFKAPFSGFELFKYCIVLLLYFLQKVRTIQIQRLWEFHLDCWNSFERLRQEN